MPEPTYLKVTDHLRYCFRHPEFPPNVFINESAIAGFLGISRTPARKALKSLAQEELLIPLSTRGFTFGPTPPGARLQKLCSSMMRLDEWVRAAPLANEWERIFDRIENDVVRLSMVAGWRLNERMLAECHGVSRSVAHEVLTRLEVTGLVARKDQSRWAIVPLDERRLVMIYDIRSWIEPNLLYEAVKCLPDKVIDDAVRQHQEALDVFPDVSGVTLDALENTMHVKLLTYAENPMALMALRAARAGLIANKHILASREFPLHESEPFIKEHLSILDAIQRRDATECRLRYEAHLILSRSKVIDRIGQFVDTASVEPPYYVSPLDL